MNLTVNLINDDIFKRFVHLEKNGKLGHAYLFIGPSGIGKGETALAIAKHFNGKQPDNQLFSMPGNSEKLIDAGQHPDVHVVDSAGETIKIEQVRELIHQEKLRPYMASTKIFIIKNAENLTLEASNALLKTLEEPSSNSLIILTTTAVDKMLDTIKSRCHYIYFHPLAQAQVVQTLLDTHAVNETQAHFLAYFSDGCVGKAKRLQESDLWAVKNKAIDAFILSVNSDDYIKGVLADKETTAMFLDILLSWLRDAMLVKANVNDDRLMHIDRIKELRQFASRFDFEQLNDVYQETVNTKKLLADNLNVKVSLMIIKESL